MDKDPASAGSFLLRIRWFAILRPWTVAPVGIRGHHFSIPRFFIHAGSSSGLRPQYLQKR